MYRLQKVASISEALLLRKRRITAVQFAKIRARRKNRLARTRNDADGSLRRKRARCSDKLFKLREHCRTNFIGGWVVERQLNHPLSPLPTPRLSRQNLHSSVSLAASRGPLPSYISVIFEAKRAVLAEPRRF